MAVCQNNWLKNNIKYFFFYLLVRASTFFMGVEDQNIALARSNAFLMGGKKADDTG